MRTTILIILLFQLPSLFAQKIRPKVDKVVKNLIEVNELKHEHTGIAGMTTEQYSNFIKLKSIATEKELLDLLQNDNSVIKGYASWSLADNKYFDLKSILIQFLKSKETVTSQSGCIVSESDLASEFYFRVMYQGYHKKITEEDSLFYALQMNSLDSVLLYSKKKHYLLNRALENNNSNPKNYSIIKKWALEKNNTKALIELAKYQKTTDINQIIKKGKDSFMPISYFPNANFWDFLMQYETKQNSLDYYLAVAAFKNDKSKNSLSVIYNSIEKDDLESISFLSEAIAKQYYSGYQDLALLLFKNHRTIDLILTKKLIQDCPEKSSKEFSKGLLNNHKNNFLELDYNYGTKDSILPLILNQIYKYDRKALVSICNKNINSSDFTELGSFLNIVLEKQIIETQATILIRLKEKNQAYEIFHLTETLLSFDSEAANKELTQVLISTQKNWDWGNWSEHFRELLKKYNIKIE